MPKPPKSESKKSIETFTHDEAKRTNIPTAEHQSVMKVEDVVSPLCAGCAESYSGG